MIIPMNLGQLRLQHEIVIWNILIYSWFNKYTVAFWSYLKLIVILPFLYVSIIVFEKKLNILSKKGTILGRMLLFSYVHYFLVLDDSNSSDDSKLFFLAWWNNDDI